MSYELSRVGRGCCVASPGRAGLALALASLMAAMGGASPAWAQWEVVRLHPGAGEASRAMGVVGGQQFGWVTIDGSTGHGRHGGTWNGSAGSWVDLNPAFSPDGSRVYGSDGVQQVGLIRVEGEHRAGVWAGAAGSYVSLHPAGAEFSIAQGVHGGQQAGWVTINGAWRASLWTGSAGSWVNLNPDGAFASEAFAVHDGVQVGWAWVGGAQRAGRWSGSAASWASMHPDAALASEAVAVHGGAQVGSVFFDAALMDSHASLWHGSVASWVDLNPTGATVSRALGVFDDVQVGFARVSGEDHAGLWRGSAGSWADLHALLPGAFTASSATGVWRGGSELLISGWGYDSTAGRDEALLWRLTVPAPGGVTLLGAGLGLGARRRRRDPVT